jgi:hypothetical protein
MGAKTKRFIVVSVGDTGGYGYDEHTLPVLLNLVDSHRPDHRQFTHTGVVGYFRSSKKGLEVVRVLISEAERLRREDLRFDALNIGVAEGELIGEFDWLGRLKSKSLIGGAIAEAVTAERSSMGCQSKLDLIRRSLYGENA